MGSQCGSGGGIRFLMRSFIFALFATLLASAQSATPPMGWNSWDAYGLTISEDQFRQNAAVLASLKDHGWHYAVLDEGWYMDDPFAATLADRHYRYDPEGLLEPSPARFPSSVDAAGHQLGLAPLASWLHAQGLGFGLHIVRGIPRQVVDQNLVLPGYRAVDAADTTDRCPWDDGNYGVRDNAAGQAYYDQMFRQFAQWGVDYVKVDCISDHPYKSSEIRQIRHAIDHSGRAMLLSLSPGPTQLAHAVEVSQLAQMWRIADDHWDGWHFDHNSSSEFPFGLADEFDRLAAWAPYRAEGRNPDPDMLPWGELRPHPGWGDPRHSRLTLEEEKTELTLFAITRSPLILGANLTLLDEPTRSLLTNQEVLDLDQKARSSEPVAKLPTGLADLRVWHATEEASAPSSHFYALFNLSDTEKTVHFRWTELAPQVKSAHDLWSGKDSAASGAVTLTIPAHGSALYRLR